MRRRAVILLVAWVALSGGAADAFEWQTPVTDSFNILNSAKFLYDQTPVDEDERFGAWINRLNLTAIKGPFTAGVRYDTEFYFEKEQYALKYLLEKAYVQYQDGMWFARAGDFYNRMGNGLVLSLTKRDEFGQDNTIRGGVGQWSAKGGYVELRALGGFINEGDDLFFVPSRTRKEEPGFDEEDTVYGGQMVAGVPRWGFVSARYAGGTLRYEESLGAAAQEEDDPYHLVGVGAEWLQFGGHGSLAGEYAWYVLTDQKKTVEDVETEGRAAYASLNLNFGPVTFIGEGQDYFRFTYPHSEPPILEFEKQTFGHLPDRTDILGARGFLEVEVPVIDVSVFGNYYRADRHKTAPGDLAAHYEGEDLEQWVEHSYGGVEKQFANGAYVMGSGGYREEPEGRWVHGEFDAGTPVAANHELTIESRWKDFSGMGIYMGTEYGSYSVAPTWNWASRLSVTGRYEHSDEPLSSGSGLSRRTKDDPEFWSGEATVKAGTHVEVTIFYGRIKGGLVCSGGVCREVPPFDGARADLTLKF